MKEIKIKRRKETRESTGQLYSNKFGLRGHSSLSSKDNSYYMTNTKQTRLQCSSSRNIGLKPHLSLQNSRCSSKLSSHRANIQNVLLNCDNSSKSSSASQQDAQCFSALKEGIEKVNKYRSIHLKAINGFQQQIKRIETNENAYVHQKKVENETEIMKKKMRDRFVQIFAIQKAKDLKSKMKK